MRCATWSTGGEPPPPPPGCAPAAGSMLHRAPMRCALDARRHACARPCCSSGACATGRCPQCHSRCVPRVRPRRRGRTFDADRLIDLLSAFESFTVHAASARGDMDLIDASLSSSLSGSMDAGDAGVAVVETLPTPAAATSASGGGGGLVGGLSSFAAPLAAAFLPGFPGAVQPSALGAARQDARTREALRFLFSNEGAFFRDFLTGPLLAGVPGCGAWTPPAADCRQRCPVAVGSPDQPPPPSSLLHLQMRW